MSTSPVPMPPPPDSLQFETAEYAADLAGAQSCSYCKSPLRQQYFEVSGSRACEPCKEQAIGNVGSPAGRFLRAVFLGGIAALVGTAVYFGVTALTGYELSLIAIVVGLIVGVAVKIGSRNRGGLAYQLMAVGLTFLAILGAYGLLANRELFSEAALADAELNDIRAAPWPVRIAVFAVGAAIAQFSPDNIMGLIILGIGLWQAWVAARSSKSAVRGPFAIAIAPIPIAVPVSASTPTALPPVPGQDSAP